MSNQANDDVIKKFSHASGQRFISNMPEIKEIKAVF